MSVYEIKSWVYQCDQCRFRSEVVQAVYAPGRPDGWEDVERTRELTDSYAPPRYTLTLCPMCVEKEK